MEAALFAVLQWLEPKARNIAHSTPSLIKLKDRALLFLLVVVEIDRGCRGTPCSSI
jgi:hypothetical protein